MSKLAISDVGPIKKGLGDAKFIEFDGLTLLIGTQGSGKSTVAKVYSSLCWLEKALARGDVSKETVESTNYFLNDVMSFQGISDYFSHSSNIHFIGEKCEFKLTNLEFTVRIKPSALYASPKIMYVPAERNFLTSIARPDLISKLPRALHAFLAEYEEAKSYNQSKPVDLPIGNIKYQYDAKNNVSFLVGDDFKTNLLNGSSGYQSLVPLHLVTKYLSNFVSRQDKKDPEKLLNVALERRMAKELQKILTETEKDKEAITSDMFLEKIQQLQKRFFYSAFVNIVEEPEQNLYPDSQKKVLFELIEALNSNPQNRLIITTHSPYILNFITLNLQAFYLYNSPKKIAAQKLKKLKAIVPEAAAIAPNAVKVYELTEKGLINYLELENGFIPDNNKLNYKLEEINEQFSDLLDIEE